jgi:hypothetical protein
VVLCAWRRPPSRCVEACASCASLRPPCSCSRQPVR